MSKSADAAIATVRRFIKAFNKQDHAALAATLNYPHIRLANGRFFTVETAADFAKLSERGKSRLAEEGWHHTETGQIHVVHDSGDKVHLALTMHRCHADGLVYNTFETLWIATLIEDHWGIQFRSSYLR